MNNQQVNFFSDVKFLFSASAINSIMFEIVINLYIMWKLRPSGITVMYIKLSAALEGNYLNC